MVIRTPISNPSLRSIHISYATLQVEPRQAEASGSEIVRGYSQMVYYVRVRMAIAVVRANSLLIRGSRDRQQSRRPLIPDGAALGDWQTWQDN